MTVFLVSTMASSATSGVEVANLTELQRLQVFFNAVKCKQQFSQLIWQLKLILCVLVSAGIERKMFSV